MLSFDHTKMVRREPLEVKRFRDWLLGGQAGEFSEVAVVHASDGSCCRRESWEETAHSIIGALKPPIAQVFLNLNTPEVRA